MFIKNLLLRILDFFYPFFSKIIDKKNFNYGVCGASNLFLGWFLYFIIFNFILFKKNIHFDIINQTFSAKTFTVWIVFIINFCVGFLLMKYIVFIESELRGRIQLLRYVISSFISVIFSTLLLKFLVEKLCFYPTLSFVISTLIVVITSYLLQKKYTFK